MKRSFLLCILGVIFLLAACFCGYQVWRSVYVPPETMLTESAAAPTPDSTPTSAPAAATPRVTETPELTAEPELEKEPYVSPIDFDSLRSQNSDVHGWLWIPDTNIDYPVAQSTVDDAYYLTHDIYGRYTANGAVFYERLYNAWDFSDPVTILYGHHMSSGAMFGNLESYYTDEMFFSEGRHIYLYTPDELLEYGVFAAVPYSGAHILYYNDFTDDDIFADFFADVMSIGDSRAHFNKAFTPEPGDRVLILSTCLAGNNTRRFLVMATLLT